ncbi:IS66 family transposase [Gracilibacillus salinarum]|uniref:IS66 family transposase n=1 Tax=Gracilibacillus salinarum TaxID=2932255 RepID=A0ABY4GR73_9BACI|nr:IS66 family transposase [Gracilibacillus salinarum]UOQ86736.1 IS66 family transposase [Gracilibacillus salinarum]
MSSVDALTQVIQAQAKQIDQLTAQLAHQANEMKLLREQAEYLTQKLFGKSKESIPTDDNQLSLFDAPEAPVPLEEEKETITYHRKKSKGRKQTILHQFSEHPVHHELVGDACACPTCETTMKEIGSYPVREELVYIPAELNRHVHYQHAYKCEGCSQKGMTDKIVKAPVPKAPMDNSLGSASIIAQTIHQKFSLKVPAYRQEEDWHRMGLPITRQHITNWHIKVSQYYLEPFYQVLKEKLVEQDILHADETSYRVLESDTKKTYYWTFLSGKHSEHPITLYHHDASRGSHVAKDFLSHYKGYVHCDMWSAYQALEKTELAGCWAHVRRKFWEAMPKDCPADAVSRQGVEACDRFFRYERSWESLSPNDRLKKREEVLQPEMDNFFDWLRAQPVLSGSKLGTAIEYALKYEATFRTVLKDDRLVLDNNRAERAMKAFVTGRKNWLFSATFEGAKAAAVIMSLIETAKQNNLIPETYITYLLEELPNRDILADSGKLEAYLPWHPTVQARCQKNRKLKRNEHTQHIR